MPPPPDNERGGPGRHQSPPEVSVTTKTTNTNESTVQPMTGKRSTPKRQTALPSFVPAEALIPSPGRAKVALIVRNCPRCGGEHVHRCEDPAPPVLSRRAGCGQRYDLYPYRLKTPPRGRRAA